MRDDCDTLAVVFGQGSIIGPYGGKPEPKEDNIMKQTKNAVTAEEKETVVKAPAKKAPAKKAAARETSAEKKAPAKKAAAKEASAEKKAPVKRTASKKAVKAEVSVQFAGKEYTAEKLVEIAKDVWQYDLGKKAADFKEVRLYVKPEENAVYYVINGEVSGSFAI